MVTALLSLIALLSVNVRDYGATGDGVTDDAPAFRAAFAAGAGGDVYVPDGIYALGRDAAHYWCASVPTATRVLGESQAGAVLLQAPGIAGSVRTLEVDGAGVRIENLTLDGNRDNQSLDEHRANVFATAAGLTMRNVTTRNSSGDGVYLYTGASGALITNVTSANNGRNGITFGGGMTGARLYRSTFSGNRAQQVDSEPGANGTVNDVLISECVLTGAGISGDYILTTAGQNAANMNTGWRVEHSVLDGPIEIIAVRDIAVTNNVGTNTTAKSSVTLIHGSDRTLLEGNTFVNAGTGPAVIDCFGTAVADVPDHVVIRGNKLTQLNTGHGIHITATRSIEVVDNEITGNGIAKPYTYGIYARSTSTAEPILRFVATGNRIIDASGVGIGIAASPGPVGFQRVSGNTFTASTSAMATATYMSPASESIRDGNALYGSCTNLGAVPPGSMQTWGDGGRWTMP